MEIKFFLKQGGLNMFLIIDGDGHVNEIHRFREVTKFPGKAWEGIHGSFEVFPFKCIRACIGIGRPDADNIINEVAVEDDMVVVLWEEFFFMYVIIHSCVW